MSSNGDPFYRNLRPDPGQILSILARHPGNLACSVTAEQAARWREMSPIYAVVRAFAMSVNVIALNWSHWHQNQVFGHGLLALSTVAAIAALAWPERYRGTRAVFRS